jgi:hypothetical protein
MIDTESKRIILGYNLHIKITEMHSIYYFWLEWIQIFTLFVLQLHVTNLKHVSPEEFMRLYDCMSYVFDTWREYDGSCFTDSDWNFCRGEVAVKWFCLSISLFWYVGDDDVCWCTGQDLKEHTHITTKSSHISSLREGRNFLECDRCSVSKNVTFLDPLKPKLV